MEGVGDAGGGYFDALAVFGGEGAVFEGGGEEVDYGERETLFCVKGGRLDDRVSGGTWRSPAVLTMMALERFGRFNRIDGYLRVQDVFAYVDETLKLCVKTWCSVKTIRLGPVGFLTTPKFHRLPIQ